MTKSRRVYVGLMSTAIVAFGVDRFILQGEPDSASATPMTNPVAAPLDAEHTEASENSQPETLAQVLASLGAAAPIERNCFAIPDDWRPQQVLESGVPTDPLPPLLLTSTSPAGAVINGRPSRIGAFVDADETIRLISVGEFKGMASAIVEFSGVRYRLLAGSNTPEMLDGTPDPADRAGSGG